MSEEPALRARVPTLVHEHVDTLVFAVKVLRIPAALAGLPAISALVLVTLLAATAQGWWRVGLLAACAVGWVGVTLWWIRVKRYHDAIRDPHLLAEELVAALAMFDSGGEAFTRMLAVFEGGGLRVVYRLRSLWRVVRIPDYVTTQIEDLHAARWFIPPMPATTAARFTILIWTTVASWVALLVLVGLRIGGVV